MKRIGDQRSASAPAAPGDPAAAVSTKRKGGRPTRDRSEQIRRAIMDAAEEEFLRARLDGAVMESIAAAAGVSKTTVYGRYPTKEALFRALLEERIEAWSQENRRYDHLLS